MKNVKISDFLSNSQMRACVRLGPDVIAIENQIITPNIAEINHKLGQENDPAYLAYVVHFCITSASLKSFN